MARRYAAKARLVLLPHSAAMVRPRQQNPTFWRAKTRQTLNVGDKGQDRASSHLPYAIWPFLTPPVRSTRPIIAQRFGGPRVSRSTLVSLVFRTLIATPVFCASFAAYSGSLELSALIKEPKAGCDEKASFPSRRAAGRSEHPMRAARTDGGAG